MKTQTTDDSTWQVPAAEINEFAARNTKYCVCIPVINEGARLKGQLEAMRRIGIPQLADILILDGGSTDGSTHPDFLKSVGVRTLLIKTGPGKLSAQLRMGYAWALRQGYEGIITVDGNGKDGIEAIPDFIRELDAGSDLVQGSRYVPGGQAINTPLVRALAIHLLHAPIISLAAGFRYTDTTNGFRAYSRRFLLDPGVQPFRNIFSTYELLAYLSVRGPRTGHLAREIPVRRQYPDKGKIPTKISHFRGNLLLIKVLLRVLRGDFDPESGSLNEPASG
ncbi:MAG TPA: glycosyltransferase family 2 protein [Blastocatellia bacterium]|nr:glycosyltransferase family 2 protein [Blastocatellia bacterium]